MRDDLPVSGLGSWWWSDTTVEAGFMISVEIPSSPRWRDVGERRREQSCTLLQKRLLAAVHERKSPLPLTLQRLLLSLPPSRRESVFLPGDLPPPACYCAVGSEGENGTAGAEGDWGRQAGVRGSRLPLERSVCITDV